MTRRTLLGISVASVALCVSLVAVISNAGPKRKFFRPQGLPFEVAEAGPLPKPQRGADGRIHFEQRLTVKIDGDSTEKPVSYKASHADAAEGSHLYLAVTEETGRKTSQFAYTPANNTIALGAETDSVSVTKNPDGSYTVGGQKAPNGKAAAALLRANPAYKAIPRENLLVAYASAQTPVPEVKGGPTCDQGGAQGATGPAVCTIFKDLCDCIACDVAAKGAACAACK